MSILSKIKVGGILEVRGQLASYVGIDNYMGQTTLEFDSLRSSEKFYELPEHADKYIKEVE